MALTKEQLEIRRKGVTATDISAIAGLNSWRSPLAVYNDKIGEGLEVEENEAMERGQFLEPGLRGWYEKRTGTVVTSAPTIISKRNPLIIATPDGLLSNDAGVLEIKSPGEFVEEWGEPGTDEVPEAYLLQGAWQMAATELPRCDFAALLRGKLCIYTVARDIDLEESLITKAERFWADHVVPRVPPKPTAPDLAWLKKKYPSHSLDYLDGRAHEALIHDYRVAEKLNRNTYKVLDGLKAQLQSIIGEHAGIRLGDSRIDWKQNRSSPKTDWSSVVLEVRNSIALEASAGPNKEAFGLLLDSLDRLIAERTVEQPGARPFRAYWKGNE